MAVLQMLSKMVGAKEFFSLVTLSKLVHVVQVFSPSVPVGRQWEFFAAVPANVGHARVRWGRMESGMDTSKRGARPRMTSQMQRVLVSFGLVFVFEAIWAELACVLLLQLVHTMVCCQHVPCTC